MSADPFAGRPATAPSSWAAPLALVVLVGAVSAGANFASDTAATVIRAISGAVVVAALVYGARKNDATPRAAWTIIATAIAVWVTGDALWGVLQADHLNAGSHWFIVPNVLYLITYPALFVAVVLLVGRKGRPGRLSNVIDCAILSLAGALILRTFLVDAHFNGTTLDNIFSAAFPLGDALLLGAVAWLLFESGLRNPSAWLFAGGMALMLTTDVIWDLEVRFSSFHGASWVNPSYPVAYALIAAAALHPAVARLSGRAQPALRYHHPARLVFLSVSLFVVSFVAWRGSRHDILIELCTVGLVIVIVIRFAVLVRSTEKAYEKADTNERRFRLLATAAPVGIYETDADFRIVFANEEAEQLAGSSVIGMTPGKLLTYAVDERDREAIRQALDDVGSGRRASAQFRVRGADGEKHWVAWYGTPSQEGSGPFAGALASTIDITALKDAEAKLARQATHDPLTGLPNRRLLFDRLGRSLARLARQPGTIAVLFLDLDNFKPVNDELGHEAGDELLEIVARRLADTTRDEDTVARFGGDEFVVILERVAGRGHAATVATKIIEAIGAPAPLQPGRAEVQASVGIALTADTDKDPDALLHDADAAMYLAKEAGGARYRFFDDTVVDDESVRARSATSRRRD
ncbi:MAG TPA: sensor domain-containing diguanylate cyclase [Mycobacteriales bacterium]